MQFTDADVDARPMHEPKMSAFDEHQYQRQCFEFESFLAQQDLRMYWPNSYTTEKQIHLLMFMKNHKYFDIKMPLNMKNF